MDHIFGWIGLMALPFVLWKLFAGLWKKAEQERMFAVPSDVTLTPQPLLTDRELLFYNLIRMAVQDRYLVFAQVPLRCMLHVDAERSSRLQVLRRLALKNVDFALVHPGSRVVEQVVQLDDGLAAEAAEQVNRREIQAMVQAAGIRWTTISATLGYNVQQLTDMLGTGEPE